MQAKDIMSAPVVSIGPDFPVLEIAALLIEHRIGGLPVILDGRLIGIVTGSDLLHRHEIETDDGSDTRSWWRRILGGDTLPAQYVKSHGSYARYVMTRSVVCVTETTPLSEIARIFDAKGIGRVPVIADERVVGIVTGADLLKTIAATKPKNNEPQITSDQRIQEALLGELTQQPWWNKGWSNVEVAHGVVTFRGLVESEAQKLAARVAAENVAGVRSVLDERIPSAEFPVMM